jgi:hypothetical protein
MIEQMRHIWRFFYAGNVAGKLWVGAKNSQKKRGTNFCSASVKARKLKSCPMSRTCQAGV